MSVCPNFDDVKFDHWVKVVMAFFLIMEDVTWREEERKEGNGKEEEEETGEET